MREFLVRNSTLTEDVQRVVSAIHDHFDEHIKSLNIKFTDRRSLTANSQLHVWIKQISDVTGEDTFTVLCRIKRDFGLPILLSDSEHGVIADYILQKTGFDRMNDAQQLKIISAMEVTRNFTTKQHKEMRDNMQSLYNNNGFNLQYLEKE